MIHVQTAYRKIARVFLNHYISLFLGHLNEYNDRMGIYLSICAFFASIHATSMPNTINPIRIFFVHIEVLVERHTKPGTGAAGRHSECRDVTANRHNFGHQSEHAHTTNFLTIQNFVTLFFYLLGSGFLSFFRLPVIPFLHV